MKHITIKLTDEHDESFRLNIGKSQSREIYRDHYGRETDAYFPTGNLAPHGAPFGTLPEPQSAMDYALATFATYKDHTVKNDKAAKAEANEIAVNGYQAPNGSDDNPYLWSSDNWLLFELGVYFNRTGRATPCNVSKSRGFSVNANTMKFRLIDANTPDFERL